MGIVETQLVAYALGDCKDLTILDLGGGTGLRAREALDHGAKAVDVVDLSQEMMRIGEEIEKGLKRDKIRWFEADLTQPIDHLPLTNYDLVMANWVFDHANTMDELEAMWRNVVLKLKPGGRFVGVRSANPNCPAIVDGRYGIRYKDHVDVPGGIKFRYVANTTPPIDFEACSMEVSFSGSTDMHGKYGLYDAKIEPYENAEILRNDPGFWKLFLEEPSLAVVSAKKKKT